MPDLDTDSFLLFADFALVLVCAEALHCFFSSS